MRGSFKGIQRLLSVPWKTIDRSLSISIISIFLVSSLTQSMMTHQVYQESFFFSSNSEIPFRFNILFLHAYIQQKKKITASSITRQGNKSVHVWIIYILRKFNTFISKVIKKYFYIFWIKNLSLFCVLKFTKNCTL